MPIKNPTGAVITGASRGVGFAIARALGHRGLRVALLAPATQHLNDAETQLKAEGITAWALPCDVTQESDITEASERILTAWGPPEVLVANAGIVRRGPVHELAVSDFDAVMAVNLRGAFLLARAFIGSMRKQCRGRFVALGSISGTLGTANASAYNASKWAIIGFVKSLAEELRGTGLQAIVINPGSVDTDMLTGSPYLAQMSPDEVASLVVYAALDAPDAINGAALDMFGP